MMNFKKFKVLSSRRHGYVQGKATETVVFETNQYYQQWKKKLQTGLFSDLFKAVDCVNINALLMKLGRYGIVTSS